jgi:hypothetical protein
MVTRYDETPCGNSSRRGRDLKDKVDQVLEAVPSLLNPLNG